jgi:serine/threonine protein kinase
MDAINLNQYLTNTTCLDKRQALNLINCLTSATLYIHANGIVHKSLSLQNIRIVKDDISD